MDNVLILSEKKWNRNLLCNLQKALPYYNYYLIDDKNDFTLNRLVEVNPIKIFIPHWSYIIPPEIYERYECVVFHMTDLPYGRGGSPLQNLIGRKFEITKMSAFRVVKELDAGPIYMKEPLLLVGTAEEIFIKANKIIEKMIFKILSDDISPVPQEGSPTLFKRRKPEESNMESLTEIEEIYDYIRMVDADGYPHAFIEKGDFRYEFTRASLKSDGSIIADVKIFKKNDYE